MFHAPTNSSYWKSSSFLKYLFQRRCTETAKAGLQKEECPTWQQPAQRRRASQCYKCLTSKSPTQILPSTILPSQDPQLAPVHLQVWTKINGWNFDRCSMPKANKPHNELDNTLNWLHLNTSRNSILKAFGDQTAWPTWLPVLTSSASVQVLLPMVCNIGGATHSSKFPASNT